MNRQLAGDFERVGGENALGQIEDMKKEIGLLTEEVTALTDELLKRGRTDDMASTELTEIDPVSESDIEDTGNGVDLSGMRVAYVGGVESLMPHYRGRSNPLVAHSATTAGGAYREERR